MSLKSHRPLARNQLTIDNSIDTFKQFFPKIDPCGGSRLRAQPAANIMRKAMLDYFQTLSSDDDAYAYLYANEWVASTRLNADTNEQFTTWEAFYCPHTSNGDSFTTTICIQPTLLENYSQSSEATLQSRRCSFRLPRPRSIYRRICCHKI